ncbi:MAG: hypothetical protein IKB62_01125 [Oscillospiraceae bacterium]|nr:hypothetical protein [Oscillospiraceae bacterium]
MKKLLALILTLSLAGCSASQPADKTDNSIYENPPTNSVYKSLNNRISATKAGDGCAYTIIRHSDTIEIGVIDIETATIKPLSEETAVEKVGLAPQLFFTDGYLYLVQNDSIHSYSGKMYQIWYQFSEDGKLLNSVTIPDYIMGTGTDFVSDGEKIYFTGKDMEENEGIISIDHKTMTVENFYDYDDSCDYMLMGASNDKFVIKEIVISKAEDGVLWQKSNYFLFDPSTKESEYIIEQSDYLREMFGDNYITCPADGGTEVYNITDGKSTVIPLPQAEKGFVNFGTELLPAQNHFIPKYFDIKNRESEIYYICNTQTGSYLEVDGSTAIKGILPKITACVDGYYLTETPGDTITVSNGKEVVDFTYSWIKVSDLLGGKQNYTEITKEFEYH